MEIYTHIHKDEKRSNLSPVSSLGLTAPFTEKDQRKTCERVVNIFKECVETRDFKNLDIVLEPKAVLNRCNEEIIGRKAIIEFLQDSYNNVEVHMYLKRVLIDLHQRHIACEWVTRRKAMGESVYTENMSSWYMKLSSTDFTVKTWYIWIDTIFTNTIMNLSTPLPKELWEPYPHEYYNPEQISDILTTKMKYFENEDIENWMGTLHDEIIIRPPWDSIVGKESCQKGAELFYDHYENTTVSRIELLHDETKPNWAVYLQIFSTTNKETGQRGEDIDYIFIEIVGGKIRYWRSYFNTQKSVQKPENTFKFFIQSLSKTVNENGNEEAEKYIK
eukprot:gene2293-2829_t